MDATREILHEPARRTRIPGSRLRCGAGRVDSRGFTKSGRKQFLAFSLCKFQGDQGCVQTIALNLRASFVSRDEIPGGVSDCVANRMKGRKVQRTAGGLMYHEQA